MDWILAIHVFLTFYLTGVIWFVQIVHYPLMSKVGYERFKDYEKSHTWLTIWVVGPQMIAELGTGIWLWSVDFYNPGHWINIGLLLIIWLSTFFVQSRLHTKLTLEFKPEWHRQLVRSNWIRTVAWTVRSLLLIWLLL